MCTEKKICNRSLYSFSFLGEGEVYFSSFVQWTSSYFIIKREKKKKPKVLFKKKKKNFSNPSRASSSLSEPFRGHDNARLPLCSGSLAAHDHSGVPSTSQRLAEAGSAFHRWDRATFRAREYLEGRVWHISVGTEDQRVVDTLGQSWPLES